MKTAGELQITQQEYDALIETQAMLAHGDMVWQDRTMEYPEWIYPEPMQFNMSTIFASDGKCHTTCCIGGWMAVQMGIKDRWDVVNYVNNRLSPALAPLCFPDPGIMNLIQPAHAVKAIDNFFNTGFPMWQTVLRGTEALSVHGEIEDARHRQYELGEARALSESHALRGPEYRPIVDLGRYTDSTEHDAIERNPEPLLVDHKG